MKSILYLGFAIPKEIQDEVNESDSLPHFATNKFSWSLVKALNFSFKEIYIISSAEIRNYPAAKRIFFRTQKFQSSNYKGLFIGFINIILLKHISRLVILFFKIGRIIKKKQIKHIIVHGTHTPFMLVALWSKWVYNTQIAILLTDQHGAEVPSDGFLGRVFRNADTKIMLSMLKRMDSFICLSELFVSKYNLSPSLVIPGILNSEFSSYGNIDIINTFSDNKKETIVFAGGINKQNGIDILLASIKLIPSLDIDFIILGNGDLVQKVIEEASNDPRIKFYGVKHGKELYQYLLTASLLINPRPVHEEYSRTSFPSKLIEYMSTGVPILTTKLESIPNEIKDCFFYIERPDAQSIASSIYHIISLNKEDRINVGMKAKNAVREFYSEEKIGDRIHDLIIG